MRLAELIVEVESGRHEASEPGPGRELTVAQLAEMWQEANRPRQDPRNGSWIGWSPKTAITVADGFRLYINPAIGRQRAQSVTGVQLDRLYRSIEEELGLSVSVVRRCHDQVRGMYNWALRKKLVDSNPAIAADPPKRRPRRLDVPAMSEVRAVQHAASADFAVFIQLAATVGARRGTLVALRWEDMDLERGTITFSRSIAKSFDGPVEKGTKADRTYTVSLGPTTLQEMALHKDRCTHRGSMVGVQFGPRSFVFSDDGGVSPWGLEWPTHAWIRYSRKTGLRGLRLHDLRHTAASQMLMAGVPVSVVAERLGCTEANILTTYRHFITGADREAADLMDRLFMAPPEGAA